MTGHGADRGGVTITIPAQPAYACSPNTRKHWRVRHREAQDLKAITKWVVIEASEWQPTKSLTVHGPVDLHWTIRLAKGRRVMDRDNATATLKPAMDGLVAAGVIDGDTAAIVRAITVDQVIWSEHKGQPEIEVRITPARESA